MMALVTLASRACSSATWAGCGGVVSHSWQPRRYAAAAAANAAATKENASEELEEGRAPVAVIGAGPAGCSLVGRLYRHLSSDH